MSAAAGRADQALRDRKDRDRALILPLAGLILLMPPVARIVEIDVRLCGIPLTVIYLFSVWAALIATAAVLSRRLRDGGEAPAETDGPEPGG